MIFHLKTTHPAFATTDYDFVDESYINKIHLRHPEMDVVTLANFNLDNAVINPEFPYTGTWYEYLTGRELEVTNTEAELTFARGEYRVYTSEKLVPPTGYFEAPEEVEPEPTIPSMTLSPTVVETGMTMQILLDETVDIKSIQLFDMIGKSYAFDYEEVERLVTLEVPSLAAGVYWLSFKVEGDYFVQKFLVGR